MHLLSQLVRTTHGKFQPHGSGPCPAAKGEEAGEQQPRAGGIARERLSGRGYGETQLLNECSNGVDCTKEQHQLNRRKAG